jgi:hypothetical protein
VQKRGQEHPVRVVNRGRSTCRSNAASWWRNAEISMSFSVPLTGDSVITVKRLDTAK